MEQETGLQRFVDAQERDYPIALSEIKTGRKQSHWMWYIFPQISGLGFSETARYYAIRNRNEAESYLRHPVLGKRLKEISSVLTSLPENNAHNIFGSPDDLKLRSCMTLFSMVPGADPVFQQVLDKFFAGAGDEKTMRLIEQQA